MQCMHSICIGHDYGTFNNTMASIKHFLKHEISNMIIAIEMKFKRYIPGIISFLTLLKTKL